MIALSRSQRNIYTGVVQDDDPMLYLVGRRYRLHPVPLPKFLSALRAMILDSPVQLCVLEPGDGDYPVLVPQLSADDLVQVCADPQMSATETAGMALSAGWTAGLLGAPLVRYLVRTDGDGAVCGLDAYCHHLLLDGGGTGIIEAQLGRHLAADSDSCSTADGFASLRRAHRREADLIDGALERLTAATAAELRADAVGRHRSGDQTPGQAARGVPAGSVTIGGLDFDTIEALCEQHRVPLNVLVAAAAVAVDADRRGNTDTLLVHAVDNRFGEPDLDVATCLVNSVPQALHFAPFASVRDLVRSMDRGYVRAQRRRWLREERYRRMYLAINRSTEIEALTLNFLPQPCAAELRPFLAEPPSTTDIGPVEGATVAAIADPQLRRLHITIWDRADADPGDSTGRLAERIAATLKAFAGHWDRPVAVAVGGWQVVAGDGTVAPGGEALPARVGDRAWFTGTSAPEVTRRRFLQPWLAWLADNDVSPGAVLVFADDGSDRTVDLILACHLAGCGYSPCDSAAQTEPRAQRIAEAGIGVRIVDPASVPPATGIDHAGIDHARHRIDARLAAVAADPGLAQRTAYVMPTSGTTGEPKLVRVSHGSLAAFCAAMPRAYGWGPADTVLQCAPLTSDISVEEIFGAVCAGATLIRSGATRTGDLPTLARDVVSAGATVLDLPTALWHLLCEDPDTLAAIGRSPLRQIIIGGESVRGTAVDRWAESPDTQKISVISSYGPTETTVIVSTLPLSRCGAAIAPAARARVGRPLLADSVFVAFGEVVVVGDPVAGYLGEPSESFGAITTADGAPRPVFATGDRVEIVDGHPVFAGRRDALTKISGRRIDTAEIRSRIGADTDIVDLAVEPTDGTLGVWFRTRRTRAGDDPAAADRIRAVLSAAGVPSFFVVAVPRIPRRPGGKVDRAALPQAPAPAETGSGDGAQALAVLWSAALGRPIGTGTSLLDEGIGSLDLIRILPPTRRLLGRPVSIFDLIAADTATNLAAAAPRADTGMDPATVAEIEHDIQRLRHTRIQPCAGPPPTPRGSIVVLGASGILGRGFAEAVLAARRAGTPLPDVVLAMRSALPDADPWASLARCPGVRLHRLPDGFGADEIDALLRDTGATTLINCIGSANMLVPYADLRPANLDIVPVTVAACLRHSVRLVHLSTSVVVDDIRAPRVVDPRRAPYPYAAVKALAEMVVADSCRDLDFTMVRLPRILGEPDQLTGSTDILVSMVDACRALGSRPRIAVCEEVTTGHAAAQAILRRVAASDVLGRNITALRGDVICYPDLLAAFAPVELAVADWKRRLDGSDWARANPGRWSIIDAWLSLGARLDGRSYAEFLAEIPSVDLDVGPVSDVDAAPANLRELCGAGLRLIDDGPPGANREGIAP